MENNNYYIATLPINWQINDKEEKIDLTGMSAAQAFGKYLELIKSKRYGHLTLRNFNGWLYTLIAEWCKGDKAPFWYDAYDEYKDFREKCGFDPRFITQEN